MAAMPSSPIPPKRLELATWRDVARDVVLWAVGGGLAFAAAGGILAFVSAPLLGTGPRTAVLLCMYIGGVIGVLLGSVWRSLDDVERKLAWGPLIGGGLGAVIGVANYGVIGGSGLLPEVQAYEYLSISPIAGAVAGLFTAGLKSRDTD